MALPKLSIIIPTRHRPQILEECLRRLDAQTIAKDLEIIIVHDGEDDEETRPETGDRRPEIQYFAISKSQQGVARNRGVEKATAPLTLFIGDDIFLEPDACEKHLAVHQSVANKTSNQKRATRNETLVLGFTTWAPSCHINATMRWLEKTGWQFGYPMIERYAGDFIPSSIQERFTYTSHISLPTTIAKQFPFREDLHLYGWEDILWGKQLRDAGIPLFYERSARALHHHHIELADSLRRMEILGRSLKEITAIDPELGRMPKGLKLMAYKAISLLPTMRGRHTRALLTGLKNVY